MALAAGEMNAKRRDVAAISAADARHLLMHAQGLCEPVDAPVSRDLLAKLIERMGFVQIDSINVLERAHHLTLFSRLHNYRRELLHDLHAISKRVFEHWTHDASLIPVQFFPNWHHRFGCFRDRLRGSAWLQKRMGDQPRRTIAEVRRRLEREGPLMSKDFERPDAPSEESSTKTGVNPKSSIWWAWKPQKAALDYLWWIGEAAVIERRNFHKVYDLAARAYPDLHALDRPTRRQFIDWSCRSALERLGAATPSEIARFWGGIEIADVRAWCARNAKAAAIEPVTLGAHGSGKPLAGFALANWRDRLDDANDSYERVRTLTRLLSPFDPVIRDRKRANRLFGFEYTFEAFVPAPKREFGYYVLPILRGDELIGRTDLKHSREQSALVVNGLWFEPKAKPTKKGRAEIGDALERLAQFIGAARVDGMRL